MAAKKNSDPAAGAAQGADPRKAATRVRAGALHAALKDVIGVISGRNTIPVLSHVRLAAGDGAISLIGSNLDMWVERDLASADRGEPDSAAWMAGLRPLVAMVPGKILLDVLGEFDPDAMVVVELDDGRVVVSAGRARFRLMTLPVEDFPLPPPAGVHASFEMACSALADGFAAVEHAISSEETRYYLNGIYLHPDGLDLKLAATDGHRLARLTFEAPDGGLSFPAVIVARQTVALLDRLCAAAVKAAPEGGSPPLVLIETASEVPGAQIRFDLPAADGGSTRVIAKTIDGSFPDYARVIPGTTPCRAVVEREAFAAAVKRVAVLGEAKSRIVKFAFEEGLVTLSVATPDLGEAREEMACAYEGAAIEIGLDARYLRDALLAAASDRLALGMTDSAGPVRIRAVEGDDGRESERLVQVLMPVRV